MTRPYRPRRACLTAPASSPRMLRKALGLGVDEVILDLEDSVAPGAKAEARAHLVDALVEVGPVDSVIAVRINDATTRWAYADVIDVVRGAGSRIDCIMFPKVERVAEVQWLDVLLTQLERDLDLPLGRIGIEAQIEGPAGLIAAAAIAAAPRVESLVFGPGDFMAAMGIPSLTVGSTAADGGMSDHALAAMAIAARAAGVQVIDGPYAAIDDPDGFAASAHRAAALGFDGKWVIHPSQIEQCARIFSPQQHLYDRAESILEAYELARSEEGGFVGAVRLDGEMIDEATRKLALATALRGRRAGLTRTP